MSEPKDKNRPKWRDWQMRHRLGGDRAERLKIALAEKEHIGIIREFINGSALRGK